MFRLTLIAEPGVLRRVGLAARSIEASRAVGMAMAETLKRWLVQKNQAGNKRGWPTTNFYGRAAEATLFEAQPGVAEIVVAQDGVRQRLYGGIINARPGKALAIPLVPEAYGKSPREFSDLVLRRTGRDPHANAVLVRPAEAFAGAAARRGRRSGAPIALPGLTARAPGQAMYLLVRSVSQEADPSVLPPDDQLLDAGAEALLEHVQGEA